MVRVRIVLTAGVLVVMAVGCATQADVQSMRREQRRLSSRVADTRASLEAMQREMARLHGRIDEIRHARGVGHGPDRLEDLEARLRVLEGDASIAAPMEGETRDGGTLGPEKAPAEQPGLDGVMAGEPDNAPEEYRKGLAAVRGGEYDRAIQSFRSFLRTNDDSTLAPNAHYWIGDSYFMLGDYYQAILNFNDVRQRYATSDRAPAAVLKIGLAFLKMGNKTEARLAFHKVVNDYPASPEAAKAKEQLQALRG